LHVRTSRALFKEVAMAQMDDDRPDDSHEQKHDPGSVREEASATGQRIKGAAKNAAGELVDDDRLEEKGERENAAGRDRQKKNDAV
jgi:uncharacterized protein YjbJ (UPF0337 family)